MSERGKAAIRIDHEGAKVFVGCAGRTGRSRIISRKDAEALSSEGKKFSNEFTSHFLTLAPLRLG